jgi:CheY-like chemotaxis protein
MEAPPPSIRGLINDLTRTLTGSLVHMDDLLLHLDNDSGEFDDARLANHQLERALEFFIELRSEYMIQQESINQKQEILYKSAVEKLLHDFNNILAGIIGCCDMIQNDVGDIRHISQIPDYIFKAIQKSPYLITETMFLTKRSSYSNNIISSAVKNKPRKTTSHKNNNVNKNILLVEDNEDVNYFISMVLYKHKYNVVSSINGEQALSIFERDKDIFCLCIVDIGLPDIEGPDLVKKLLLQKPNINVLFTSGYNEIKLKDNFALIGPYQILIKPFRLEELVSKVKSIMLGSSDLRPSIGLHAGF